MQFSEEPQRVLHSGSFTGYVPIRLEQLGKGYLSPLDHFKQPLCGNEEGWGPLSPFRYDFTPCFIDVWVFAVAAYGMACGALAIWYVLRKRKAADITKTWSFWFKQVRAPLPLTASSFLNRLAIFIILIAHSPCLCSSYFS